MTSQHSTKRQTGLFVGLLLFLALACNAPIGGPATPGLPPPENSADYTPQQTDSPETIAPTAESGSPQVTETLGDPPPTEALTSNTPTTLPTFTPIQSTTQPDASHTPTAIPTLSPTANASATATTAANSGPLSFTYTLSWEVVSGDSSKATATVSIQATGGGGDYQYFRDDIPVDGPVFQYQWATCRANPGSLRVTSADGQTLKIDYFEQPPCPSN